MGDGGGVLGYGMYIGTWRHILEYTIGIFFDLLMFVFSYGAVFVEVLTGVTKCTVPGRSFPLRTLFDGRW